MCVFFDSRPKQSQFIEKVKASQINKLFTWLLCIDSSERKKRSNTEIGSKRTERPNIQSRPETFQNITVSASNTKRFALNLCIWVSFISPSKERERNKTVKTTLPKRFQTKLKVCACSCNKSNNQTEFLFVVGLCLTWETPHTHTHKTTLILNGNSN